MRCYVLILILSLIHIQLFSQVKIYGRITDINNLPMNGAKIYIDSTYDEAISNNEGIYEFSTTEKGLKKLVVHVQGYFDESKEFNIDSLTIKLDVQCVSKIRELNSVEISANKNLQDNKENDIKSISSTEIVTTATDGNIISAFKLMPGAQQIGESGLFFSRGGAGTETKLYIDGMLVDNFLKASPSNQSSTSRFPANIFNNSKFVSSGYSAQYGQAMSGVMLMETNDLPYSNNVNVSISPIFIGADATLLNKKGKGSLTGSFAYTNLKGYASVMSFNTPKNQSFSLPPVTYEGYINYKQKTKFNGLLKLFCNYSTSNLSLIKTSIDDSNLKSKYIINNANVFSVLKWNGTINRWKIDYGLSWSKNKDIYRTDSIFNTDSTTAGPTLTQNNDLLQTKLVLSKEFKHDFTLNYGGEVRMSKDVFKQNDLEQHVAENLSAAFLELKYYPLNKLTFVFGGRYEYSNLINHSCLSPRFSAIYAFNNNTIFSLNYGNYYQRPTSSIFLYYPTTKIQLQKSDIYNFSFLKRIKENIITAEVFYKNYTGLLKTVPTVNNSGYGYAKGFELFYKDRTTFKKMEYWISYSYLDTKRIYMDYPNLVQPSFAASHTISFVSKIFFKKLGLLLSPSYSFSTGRPYYNPNKSDAYFMTDRTIPYSSLNINICYLTKIKSAFTVVVLTVSNVLAQKQIFGYNYSTIDNLKREEIIPYYKSFIFLGMFMNFGIDNRKQIIDDHL